MSAELHSKIDAFIAAIESGQKRAVIAERFGISNVYVSALASFCGLDFKTNKGVSAKNAARAASIRRDRAAGMAYKAIAFKHGVCISTVGNILVGRHYREGSS